MLGHDASFSHIHAVNLTQSKALALKRIGYLCCSLFLNESSQFLILLVANLQRDLQSTSIHEVVIALTALGKLISPMMIGGVIEPLTKLLTHTTDLVRKKAVIVLHRIYRISNVGGVNTYTIPDFND
jgi:AP-4 complex subunit epsilon-1